MHLVSLSDILTTCFIAQAVPTSYRSSFSTCSLFSSFCATTTMILCSLDALLTASKDFFLPTTSGVARNGNTTLFFKDRRGSSSGIFIFSLFLLNLFSSAIVFKLLFFNSLHIFYTNKKVFLYYIY
ncbi:hypothetical protein ES708_05883 [subsurface metagenome]